MSLQEQIQNEIQNTVPMMIDDALTAQSHNGSDGVRIFGRDIANAPQSALTPASGGSLSTGGATTLSTSDSTILSNAIARIDQLESRLQALGFIN